MTSKPLNSWTKAGLEFGPVIGFVVLYLILRNETFLIAGRQYGGFMVVMAAFIPIFVLANAALWYLEGSLARIQIATAVMLVVFGGLSLWLNDPRVFKMKPTVIYLTLGLILSIGFMRGRSWLEYIMEDMVPLKPKGWHILTKRVIALFFLSAAANELVWRTQSEEFWVLFETLVMPIAVCIFFISQIGLVVEYATFKNPQKRD